MTRLALRAPLAGWSTPPEEIPDEVFAKRMLGDGVAIDPVGNVLHAPCDGEVISIAASRHAIALRHANGAEILMHVGIDTVGLAGEGFDLLVRKGERVHAGDPLLKFDLDLLARKAASLVTPIVITNGERFRVVDARVGREVAVGDELLTLEALESGAVSAAAAATARTPVVTESVVVRHAHGIHARPAALIARQAKTLPVALELRARGRGVDPRSVVALMSLGVRGGDEVVIAGFTPAAAGAVAELARVVRGLEKMPAHASAPAPVRARASAPHGSLGGVIASRGFAIGKAFHIQAAEIAVTEAGRGADTERAALAAARATVRARLSDRARALTGAVAEVIEAHLELLDDATLTAAADRAIAGGKSAGFAWRAASRECARGFAATGDALLAERVDDLLDLERQILVALGHIDDSAPVIPRGAVLLARELKPSQLIDVAPDTLAGIALAAGGPTSHVAILAGVMGIPMLVAVGDGLLDVRADTVVILDADSGTLRAAPAADEIAAAERELGARRERRVRELAAAQRPCHLASGERIEVLANLVGTVADATLALEQGAEGCGLLRTEFLFLERETAPDEDEQVAAYDKVAEILAGRPLVIRTLDAGGDKPIPYLPLPAEENPALGLRGIRTSLWRPDLLETQLRALLRLGGRCRILLPMITDVAEVRTVRRVLDEQRTRLSLPAVPLGVMIETPAAALLADQLAANADFLSIGTNDLAQYTLAMDRGHSELAARIDGVHPAVLRLIGSVCDAAARHRRPVAVCGGLASDPAAVPLLLGLGVTELSAVPAAIPRIKSLVGSLSLEACRQLAQRALSLPSSDAVRAMLVEHTPRTEGVAR
jgi:phosphoenolpyruvate-protein phosphotransferase